MQSPLLIRDVEFRRPDSAAEAVVITLSDGLQSELVVSDDTYIGACDHASHRQRQIILLPIPKVGIEVIDALELFHATVPKIAPAPLLDVGAHEEAATLRQTTRLFVRRYAGRYGMSQR